MDAVARHKVTAVCWPRRHRIPTKPQNPKTVLSCHRREGRGNTRQRHCLTTAAKAVYTQGSGAVSPPPPASAPPSSQLTPTLPQPPPPQVRPQGKAGFLVPTQCLSSLNHCRTVRRGRRRSSFRSGGRGGVGGRRGAGRGRRGQQEVDDRISGEREVDRPYIESNWCEHGCADFGVSTGVHDHRRKPVWKLLVPLLSLFLSSLSFLLSFSLLLSSPSPAFSPPSSLLYLFPSSSISSPLRFAPTLSRGDAPLLSSDATRHFQEYHAERK